MTMMGKLDGKYTIIGFPIRIVRTEIQSTTSEYFIQHSVIIMDVESGTSYFTPILPASDRGVKSLP